MNRPGATRGLSSWPREKQDAFFADVMKAAGADADEGAAMGRRHYQTKHFAAFADPTTAASGLSPREGNGSRGTARDGSLRHAARLRPRASSAARQLRMNKGQDRRSIASAEPVAAVERPSPIGRRLCATVHKWDTDPSLSTRPTA